LLQWTFIISHDQMRGFSSAVNSSKFLADTGPFPLGMDDSLHFLDRKSSRDFLG
jgi:hypothetical protein